MVKIICDNENERNLLLAMFDAYWDNPVSYTHLTLPTKA